jgi:hypothetical protein
MSPNQCCPERFGLGLQGLKLSESALLVLMHLLDVDVLTRRLDGSVFTLLESIRRDVVASQGQHMLARALRQLFRAVVRIDELLPDGVTRIEPGAQRFG